MALKGKGKQVAGKAPATVASGSSSGKRKMTASKRLDGGTGKRKRKRSGVLQFFDDAAVEADSDYEDDGDLEMEEEDEGEDNLNLENEKFGVGKSHRLPFLVKEEELSGDELEELIKERYGPGSEHVMHNDNPIECKDKVAGELGVPIWKVKCMVGREQQMAFCLMQKYVEFNYLETKLQIISAFALEHVKGHVFLEADKLSDVMEACKGFCNIYPSRINLVPRNEIPNLLTSSNKLSEVSEGAWVRLKNGKYKGDLAKVVVVDDKRKQVTIKLIPRIDLQAIAKKFGGGVSLRQAAVPAPRLISSHELEAFRPHIVYKRDHLTGEGFEVLDGMMLKDGYLYKKVSIGSLISWGVQPSSSELLMFTEVTKHTDVDLNWFSSIYGTHKKKPVTESSEDKTNNGMENGYNLHDLVLFGRNNFGVIVAFEKDCFKILRGDSDGSEVMSVKSQDVKKSCDDKMFTASDLTGKTIFIKDIVKTSVGPSEGREGIVRHMYRGILFIQVENESENGGFFCAKSNSCQKTNEGKVKEKLNVSSLESLTVPQDEENTTHDFNRGRRRDYDHAFSIGQSLRIREGPLKGYLCRVVGIYRSDVTVKLDSLGKLITVKDTSLAVPRALGVNSSHTTQELDNFGSREIISAAGTSGETSRQAEKSSWEAMVPSLDRDSWQPFSTSTHTGFADNKKGVEEDPWGSKLGTMTKNNTDDFGNTTDNWGKQPIPNSDEGQKSDPWVSMVHTTKQIACGSGEAIDGWGKAIDSFTELGDDSWSSKATCADKIEDDDMMKSKISISNTGGSWDMEGGKKDNAFSWDGKGKENLSTEEDTWSKPAKSQEKINQSFDDRTIVEDGWETAKFSTSNAGGSWDSEGPKKDNACSLNSKGKESLNNNNAWSQPAKSQEKINQSCDDNHTVAAGWEMTKLSTSNAEGSWNMQGAKKDSTCSLDSKEKGNSDNDCWSQAANPQGNNETCHDRTNGTDGWEKSKLPIDYAGGKSNACSWDSKGKVNSEDVWSKPANSQAKVDQICDASAGKNWQTCGNESKDQTSTWANEKSAGKDKRSDRDGKNDDDPAWNTVKASNTKIISGCINAISTKTEGNSDKARSDEAFDTSRKSSGISNWDLAESSAKNPKEVSLDKVSIWTNPEDGTDKSNSWDIKGQSKIAGDCWGKTNYQERKIDDVDNWVSNSSQIKESSTFPSNDQTGSWTAPLPLAGMAKDSTAQVCSWEKAKDSSNATETGGWYQARSSEQRENDNWNRGNSFGEEAGSDCWKKSRNDDYGFGRGTGRGQNNWDTENNQNNSSLVKPMGQGGYQRSSWGRGRGRNVDAGGDQQRPWKPRCDSDGGRGSGWGRGRGENDDAGSDKRQWQPRNDYDGGRGSGWGRGRGGNDDAGGDKRQWQPRNDYDGGRGSGWGRGRNGSAAGGGGDQQKQWNRRGDSDAGWGRGRGRNNDAGGNQQRQWNCMNDSDESRGFGRGRFGNHDNLDGGWHGRGRGRGRGNNFGNNNGAGGRGPQAGFSSSGRNNDQGNFGDGSSKGNSGSKWGQDESKGCSTNWSKDQVGNSDKEKWGNANAFSSGQFSGWSNQPEQAKDLNVEGTWKNSQDAPVAGDEGNNSWGKAAGSWGKNEGSGSMGGW